MKILSPAGNFESLKTAVYSGADEVYLGINEFNARNNIDGFNMDNLEQAVDFAHLYGVKVCLAINILFSDSELQKALDVVVDAYNFGVDYFIIQDLGLIKLVSENYPEIIIHASTQMGIHNLEGVLALEKYGIKRVVLARETPMSEIRRIKRNAKVEIEYFAQGALCVSFSGNCYLSSYFHDASGNRGRCKQLCRLPYTLEKDGKKVKSGYLLSAKDFNMLDRLAQLKDAGVDVIKIEGRARRPSYVGAVTREYFNALNQKQVNKDNVMLAFNREYTDGYFSGNAKIISSFNNHIGIKIGNVQRVKTGKNFNEVYIQSDRVLTAKSTFKFFLDGIEQNTITAYDLKDLGSGNYLITTTQKVTPRCDVHLIVDERLEQEVLSLTKKVDTYIKITAKEGQNITAEFNVYGEKKVVFGEKLQSAQNSPLTNEQLVECFNKSEYFTPRLEVCLVGSSFIQKSKLNAFRREVYSSLFSTIVNASKHDLKGTVVKVNKNVLKFTDFEFTCDFNGKYTASNVIYSPEEYCLKNVQKFIDNCKRQGVKGYLDTPNFALEKDVELLKEIVENTGIAIVANNYYALNFNTEIVVGGGLNVYNTVTAKELNKAVMSAESQVGEKIEFPYMTLRHCPIKSHVGGSCENCKYTDGYVYISQSGKTMRLKRKKMSTCTFYLYQ